MAAQINRMMASIRAARNPQEMARQIVMNNPAMRQAMQYVQQHGGDPKAAAERLMRENGIDMNQIMNGLK